MTSYAEVSESKRRGGRPRLIPLLALTAGTLVIAIVVSLAPLLALALLFVAAVGLARLGESLYDRVMVATLGGIVALVTAGLAFSLWPWGLDPRALTITAWIVLWSLALVRQRSLRFPKPVPGDLGMLIAVLATGWMARPMLTHDFAGRLARFIIGEDNARHLAIFNGVAKSGSYLFLAPPEAYARLYAGTENYPHGWHVLVAALDGFVGHAGNNLASVDHLIGWSILTHLFLVAALIWLGQRCLPHASPLATLTAAIAAGAIVTGSELSRLLVSGYPGELLAVGVLAAAASVATFAPERASYREQVLLLALAAGCVGLAYYLFLIPYLAWCAWWLWTQRRLVPQAPLFTVTVVAVGIATSLIIPLRGARAAAPALETPGNSAPVVLTLAVLGSVVVAAIATSARCRQEPWRTATVLAGTFLAFGLALGGYAGFGYYPDKIWHVTIAVLAALTASLVGIANELAKDSVRSRVVVSGAAVVCVLVATGSVSLGPGVFTDRMIGTNTRNIWASDFWAMTIPADGVMRAWAQEGAEARNRDTATESGTVLVADPDPSIAYRINVFLAALNESTGRDFEALYLVALDDPNYLSEQIAKAKAPVRLFTMTPEAEEWVKQVLAATPPKKAVTVTTLAPASTEE